MRKVKTMKYVKFIRETKITFLLALACFLGGILVPSQVRAAGGIAISGSFSQQVFKIPQGSSVSGPSINVVVFNNGSDKLDIKMSSQSPLNVQVILSKADFVLQPGGQQEVLVEVDVAHDATPGDYALSIMAESSVEGTTGIQLAGAASQTAKLTVLGDSAQITIQAKSPDGQALVAMVRLFMIVTGQNFEVAYSETGTINMKVAPGNFIAISYINGEQLAEESFTLSANDIKSVTLSGATVFFEGFGAVPNYQKAGGKIAFVQLVYTVNNLSKTVDKGEIILHATRDNKALDDVSLAILTPLEKGRVGLNYSYIPAGGWVAGTYTFQLQLKLNDKPYVVSTVTQTVIKNGAVAGSSASGVSPFLIVGIVAVFVAAAVVGLLIFRKKKLITK